MNAKHALTPYKKRVVRSKAGKLLADGRTREQAAREIAATIDAATDLRVVGPIGELIDALDDGVIYLVVLAVVSAVDDARLRRAARG